MTGNGRLLPSCYCSACSLGQAAKRYGPNWRNRSFPTHCHLDRELFLFREAKPKGDVPSNLGF
jgi:hypothetical protein